MKRFRILGVIAMMLVLAISVVNAQDEVTRLRVEHGASPIPSLDPALATDTSSIQVLNETYIGLTHLHEETLEPMPGLAESWEITPNDDGTTTYTFTLRQDVPWAKYNAETGAVEEVVDEDGNVRYVNAFDFEYGWTRTLDPRTAGDYAYVLVGQVIGAGEFNSQEVGADGTLSVTEDVLAFGAVDEYTFEVTAPGFAPYQLAIYGLWFARPQPSWVIEEFGDFWIEPENFVAYGPFVVKDWNPDESLVMIKNPFWPGNEVAPQATIDEVELLVMDASTAVAEFEAGNIDAIDDVAVSEIPRIKADPELSQLYVEGADQATYYYGFSVNSPPMDNVHLRRALSYAVDRETIVNDITQGGQTVAPFFSNPSLLAAPTVETHPDLGIRFDPDLAVEELEIALEDLGLSDVSELPPITLLFNTSESHQAIAEAIQAMWADTLGIEVQLTNQDFGVYLEQRSTFPVFRAGWGSDYPDNHNFLFDVFHSSSDNSDTGWVNEEFDALVEEAATLTDVDVRRELYAQAEEILVEEDAAIIPIYFYSDPELTQPYVERTYSLGGDQRFEKWSINN